MFHSDWYVAEPAEVTKRDLTEGIDFVAADAMVESSRRLSSRASFEQSVEDGDRGLPVEGAVIDCWELVRVKSGAPEAPAEVPVPVSATDCGEFPAAPVTVRLAVTLDAAVGAKVT